MSSAIARPLTTGDGDGLGLFNLRLISEEVA